MEKQMENGQGLTCDAPQTRLGSLPDGVTATVELSQHHVYVMNEPLDPIVRVAATDERCLVRRGCKEAFHLVSGLLSTSGRSCGACQCQQIRGPSGRDHHDNSRIEERSQRE